MSYLRINGATVRYDNQVPYLAIGVVGSSHGGEVRDVFTLNPSSRLGYKKRGDQSWLKAELTVDLSDVELFLREGVFQGDNGTRHLDTSERPAFERTAKLYHEVLQALQGK